MPLLDVRCKKEDGREFDGRCKKEDGRVIRCKMVEGRWIKRHVG